MLAESAASVTRFLASGLVELKAKLGPINGQFLPTKAFEPAGFEAFPQLLPQQQDGVALRHVVEVRHPSFCVPEFPELLRRYGIGVVVADSEKHPAIHDVTAPFVYARLQPAVSQGPSPAGPGADGGPEIPRSLHLHDQRLQAEGAAGRDGAARKVADVNQAG